MLKTFSYMAYFLIGFGFLVIVVLSFFMPQYIDSNFTEGAGIGNNLNWDAENAQTDPAAIATPTEPQPEE